MAFLVGVFCYGRIILFVSNLSHQTRDQDAEHKCQGKVTDGKILNTHFHLHLCSEKAVS